MSKRNYNIFFNTHTVSGIVISVALYVIFFTGAFALFKDEIDVWDKGTQVKSIPKEQIDFDFLLNKLSEKNHLTSRDIRFNLARSTDDIYVLINPAKDTANIPLTAKYLTYLAINTQSGKTATYTEKYGLGEFLYRLHFFSQIPYIGGYLAGIISLFFLFAIATGVIVHWKKIIPNFYQFNPKIALKRVWTDAHTALGIIGLPFQFIFALTGTYFCLSILVLIPANFLYNGNQSKLMNDLLPNRTSSEWIAKTTRKLPSVNQFVIQNATRWKNFNLEYVSIKNYRGTNMKYQLVGALNSDDQFLSSGTISYDFSTGITTANAPNQIKYTNNIQHSMRRLHFANFGGIWVKAIYFVLAFITCFVIITGVLIWIEARNKKSMTLQQRLYTAKIGHVYLAICLSLFPIIALFFLVIKLLPEAYSTQKMTILYNGFFGCWLIASIFLRFKRDNYFTNKLTLLSGAILGYLVPISSGIVSGNWIWNTYNTKQFDILTIDMLWIILASTSLLAYLKITPKKQLQSAFNKHPINYKKELYTNTNKEVITSKTPTKNYIPMRTKIVILWIFLAIGWIVHHMYGLFNIYYNETLIMEGATGAAPMAHHVYRILFEGMCLFFGLLTLEVSKQWFRLSSFVWAIIAGLYNIYHLFEAIAYESGNISEIFMLLLVAIASIFLVINIYKWIKNR
ncbi:PepSY-associated TM helix domain-containing protein [Tenacibaculum maritimum]|uniref:PepSY-associated TM helix domain-containing protein n=1 Tax=Tenacibaculum maritimum TaxID=107401 RepID=UPI0012E40178|nr:PepSY-associated TM helix domain-containing protein [Tenacibaculum maritimum]MCD9610934.1 PepSY domain-containing protein [Tenacibaculum maritimum]CAA0239940.1 Putative iron-regulated membrane protein [Tenacibaculum maritimum]